MGAVPVIDAGGNGNGDHSEWRHLHPSAARAAMDVAALRRMASERLPAAVMIYRARHRMPPPMDVLDRIPPRFWDEGFAVGPRPGPVRRRRNLRLPGRGAR